MLEGLLLAGDSMDGSERERLRRNLLAYCERDTLAMVKVVDKLKELSS